MTYVPHGDFFLWSRQGMSPFLCSISARDAGKPSHEQGWQRRSLSPGKSSFSPLLRTPRSLLGLSGDPPAPLEIAWGLFQQVGDNTLGKEC